MKRLAILLAALALTACASTPPPVLEVKVPVAVSCVSKDFQDRPDVPDTDAALKAAPDLAETLKLLLAGRTIRQAWDGAAQVQIDICRKAGGG